jgi:hypothetical protein
VATDRWRRWWRAGPSGGAAAGTADSASVSNGPLSRRAQIGLLAISFVSLIVASVTGVQRQTDSARLERYIRCQVGVNEASALANRERSAAAEVDRDADQDESLATRTLILAVFTATGPNARDDVRAAFVAYDRTLRDIDARRADAQRQRAANPLPPLPSETCG